MAIINSVLFLPIIDLVHSLYQSITDFFDQCDWRFAGMCFVPSQAKNSGIFGFAEFVQALALLIVVYTVSDVRYRFRIAIAPLPLRAITFGTIGLVGLGTLLTDFWYSYGFSVPKQIAENSIPQTALGAAFLLLVLCWTYFAFFRPPKFSKYNALKYIGALHYAISRSSTNELPVIASELARSAKAIVTLTNPIERRRRDGVTNKRNRQSRASSYGYDILRMIADPKLCKIIVSEESETVLAFLAEASEQKKYNLPLGAFMINLTHAALMDKNSVLYSEQSGYEAGLRGLMQRFSKTMYGDFELVEAMANDHSSPFDLRYTSRGQFDAEQIESYGMAIIVTLDAFLKSERPYRRANSLNRGLENMAGMPVGLYKLNGEASLYQNPEFSKFEAVVKFFGRVMDTLAKHERPFEAKLRLREREHQHGFELYDEIARHIFEIIFDSTAIKSPSDSSWWVQHNVVWSELYGYRDDIHRKIIQFKLRRLLYDEIKQLADMPNYKSARILGYCLYVMGLKVGRKKDFAPNAYALRKVVLNWASKNYLTLHANLPLVAEAVLMGSLTFDPQKKRLVKSYLRSLSGDEPKEYLELQLPRKGLVKARRPTSHAKPQRKA